MRRIRWDHWTDEELTVIYRFAQAKLLPKVMEELCALIPGRTGSAIHNRIVRLRRETGISNGYTRTPREVDTLNTEATNRLGAAIEAHRGRVDDRTCVKHKGRDGGACDRSTPPLDTAGEAAMPETDITDRSRTVQGRR